MTGPDEGGDPPCWAHLHDDAACDDDGQRLVPVDLSAVDDGGAPGSVWSLPHGGDLDANLVRLDPGGAVAPHVNDEVDVMMIVRSGSCEVHVEGRVVPLAADELLVVPRNAHRSVTAGPDGVRYLSIHRRRGALAPTRRSPTR